MNLEYCVRLNLRSLAGNLGLLVDGNLPVKFAQIAGIGGENWI